ncbi:transmembrane protein 98 [Trichonephila clavipes]|uniref:Transmembrane protein 98 n=1 Tax=Trichonephila clavipes TaxID=2585209 RepID=A0A8X6RIQ2_TRICX|nr:transmembrane protein 98 [Trichonephila clavipes]
METVVLAAISFLSIIFVGSLLALIMVCRHKYCQPFGFLTHQYKDTRPEINLISNEDVTDMELDDVRLHPNIERILTDEQWVDDATEKGRFVRVLATELGLEAIVDMTKPMLKNLITKSAGYDEEDTKLMYEGTIEERKGRELLEERKRQDNLELEKLRIKAQIGLNQKILSRNNHTPSN